MNRPLRYGLGAVAPTGFVISLVAHVSALMGVDVAASVPGIRALHVGVFVVFPSFVLPSRKGLGTTRPSWSSIRNGMPGWVVAVGVMIFAYAILNFLLFILNSGGGGPLFQNGQYLLVNHGRVIRELTATEFTAINANELRGYSGHWLAFYFFSATYYLFWKPTTAEKIAGQARRQCSRIE